MADMNERILKEIHERIDLLFATVERKFQTVEDELADVNRNVEEVIDTLDELLPPEDLGEE